MNSMKQLVFVACALASFVTISSALTPEEAKQHIGQSGNVDGLAAQVSTSKGNVYVNLGAKFPDQTFTGFIAFPDVRTVGLDYLQSLEGKTVSIVGRILDVRGKPQIQITKKEQIILIVPQASPAK
jgi:hypothetical protein